MNSSTTLPSLKAFTAGIDWIPNACESRGLASVSTLTRSTWPARLSTAFSITGPSERHGPHHSAQKSTTTGCSKERWMTSRSKVSSVASMGTTARIVAMDFRIDADGVTLAGEEAGQGSPVVLLHGLTATRRYVVMGSQALERAGHRVIAYDARAHGQSGARRRPAATTATSASPHDLLRRPRRPRRSTAPSWPAPRWAPTR